ncbi:MAG TPA: phenylalanine--tRNA ligase subunit beta [Candidatus Paceibacterota bacterium]|nr:phenylalanine--tRNA ligase subunit beta [Candidatus Paceibacterota bacterium]
MKISRRWIQNFFDSELQSTQEVADALTFHAFEIDGIEKVGDPSNAETSDEVLDVKVTPNRGHDCLSHRGIAGELSAILKLPLKVDPWAGKPDFSKATDAVSITLEDPALSPRYIAAYIKSVKVAPSPAWLVQALAAMGQRSINNVVDATNMVMFNTGQPLHAFDAGKLEQDNGKYHIVVRKARAGEKLLALDNKEYELKDSMLVIADGVADVPVGIAGIKGGTPAGITEATTDIIIESANFNGVLVRKTAQALKLRTDASSRFEQGVSPELAGYGMRQVVDLVTSIASGELIGFADVYPAPQEMKRVSVSVDKINQILGTKLTGAEVSDVFQRLQFAYKEENDLFDVEVPFQRLDIVIAEDLVEEVGRIVGYDKVPAEPLPSMPKQPEVNLNFYTAEHVRKQLTDMGYSEVFTSVFADKGEVAVLNKVDSVRPYLRANLVDGLNDALKKNIPNKDLRGLKEVKLFEIGSIWKGGKEEISAGIVTEKDKAQEEPLAMHAPKEALTQYEDLPLSTAVRYQPFSKYPYIVRDIAMWTPAGTEPDAVSKMIADQAGDLCVKISLFDQFQKAEKTSLAFRLIFQSFERTLTEVEVNEIMEKVSAALKEKGFEIR